VGVMKDWEWESKSCSCICISLFHCCIILALSPSLALYPIPRNTTQCNKTKPRISSSLSLLTPPFHSPPWLTASNQPILSQPPFNTPLPPWIQSSTLSHLLLPSPLLLPQSSSRILTHIPCRRSKPPSPRIMRPAPTSPFLRFGPFCDLGLEEEDLV
jgi:hypothetical protein